MSDFERVVSISNAGDINDIDRQSTKRPAKKAVF
jgi:hypothetical protein